jgi:thiol-disulfide isomerase/thioredoxin
MSERPPTPPPSTQPEGNFVLGLLRDWGIALAVVVAVFLGYQLLYRPVPPALGPAPDFSLTDLDGQPFALSKAGDLVVLNFWFTTCPPCRREIPELSAWHQEHPEVPMYGVSADIGMPTARLAAEVKRLGIGYPVLHDQRGDVSQLYAVDSFPTTLIIKGGKIVQARVGAVDRGTLSDMVAKAR